MTHSKDVVFGVTVSGRNAPVVGIETMAGPTIATVPVRINLASESTISEYLTSVQKQATEMIRFEQTGLQRISKSCPGAKQACAFQTLLVVQPQSELGSADSVLGRWRDDSQQQGINTYPLMLEVQLGSGDITAKATFDARTIEPWVVQNLLKRLEFMMQQLVEADTDQALSEIQMATAEDTKTIWDWNKDVPESIDRCVHEIIEARVQSQPDSPAICAWDGDLTYGQLDWLAAGLARRLIDLGVGPDMIIPLCFEKSMWAPVSMLAVLKAGGGFLMLDPSLPEQRLQSIIQQAKATLVLSSVENHALSSRLVREVVTVNSSFFEALGERTTEYFSAPSAESIAYVIFTSGTTGTPKGAALTHVNCTSALRHQGSGFGLTPNSRVYDFASYAFDVSVCDFFNTLAAGGCLCVPSEQGRKNDLAKSITSLRANAITLTRSVAQLLSPEDVPTLKEITFSGEALHTKDVIPWWDKVRVRNMYGPSECTSATVINDFASTPEEIVNIGRGAGVVTWVVSSTNHNVQMPPGYVGELLLEGPLVGRGYLNNPEKMAATFIEDPVFLLRGTPGHPGRRGRLYKTGNLVRQNEDGSLTYLGRNDAQVKIRGQRVELGEVQHWVQEYIPNAAQVAVEVIVAQGENASPELAAFLQIHGDDSETTEARVLSISAEIEDKLTEHLPAYMIPTIFFAMQSLPLSPTGKTDRRRLREIGASFSAQQLGELRTAAQGTKRQPTTQIEQKMQSIWADVLNIAPSSIGLDDSFFRLGGDSIAAMKVVGKARKTGLDLQVADIFKHRRLHSLASQDIVLHASSKDIPHSELSGPVEQSFAQGRLWFLDQLFPGSTWYLVPWSIRLRGPIQLDALNTALLSLENRHETLRTKFLSINNTNVQEIMPFQKKQLKVIELPSADVEAALEQVLQKDQTTPFDLASEASWRVSLYRLSKDHHVLSIVMHHIISDGWSIDILRKELAEFYSAAIRGQEAQLEPLPIQYRDYSTWQRHPEQAAEHRRQLDYWTTQLQTSRPAEFFCDKPRPATMSGKADVQELKIEGSIYNTLQEFCRKHEVTPFVVLLAAFRATHYRLTGGTDATIGTANANRNRWEVKDLIGFFVNMQCLRLKVDQDNESFEDLVHHVHTTTAESFANQDVPFEDIVTKLQKPRDLSRNPLVQAIFALHSQETVGEFALEGLEAEPMGIEITSRFDLEVHFVQEDHGFRGQFIFSTDLFNSATISNMRSVFHSVLQRALQEPKAAISALPLIGDHDYSALDELGLIKLHETDYPRESSIIDVFREQVSICPDRIAVKDSLTQLTYAQLDEQSNRTAYWLTTKSLSPETPVGVFAGRSCEAIIALLGILKANLAYLPFDIKIPSGRFEAVLSSRDGDKLVLVGSGVQPPIVRLKDVEFVPIATTLRQESPSNLILSSPSASSLAYIMFTSGSTGQPKGVMAEHGNVLRLMKQSDVVQHVPEAATMAHLSNLAFDASTWEIYSTLLNGGTLVCVDNMVVLDHAALSELFAREMIQSLFLTPALLKQYLQECPDILHALQFLLVGGERVDAQDIFAARKHMTGTIANVYGPTENTAFSTFYVVPDEDACANGVPIGRAISNSGAYVMDSQMRLVPLGVVGELVVTGAGLARGYTDPERNINRFITVTIGGDNVKAYRTGDYARYRSDGQLECFGRMDGQVKIRGQRVELGEVEHVLLSHDSVNDGVAVLQQEDDREAEIVGFITLREIEDGTQQLDDGNKHTEVSDEQSSQHMEQPIRDQLYEAFQTHLPSYMSPRSITILDKMPVNANGKVDRRALAAMAQSRTTRREVIRQPTSEQERQLQSIWANVLNMDPVEIGLDDNFFQLGGNSIAAMKVVGEARKLDFQLLIADVFRYPKLQDMASPGVSLTEQLGGNIVRTEKTGPVEQSFAQGRLWFLDQLYPDSTGYLMPTAIRLQGPLRLDALNSALLALENRHDTLRTVFSTEGGLSLQEVQPFRHKELNVVNIPPGDEEVLARALHRDQSTPFDLHTEPGWKITLYRVSEDEHVLSMVMHHIISDGWSVDILQKELATFYSATLRGEDPLSKLSPLPIQYQDFSAWQRQPDQAREHQRQLDYWVSELQTSRPAELFCDKPRPAVSSGKADAQQLVIDGSLFNDLQTFCRERAVTPFVVLLAAFRATHFRLTGAIDATIGMPNANRNRWEVRDMVGFFVNLQCLRIKVEEESFEELVKQVQATTIASFANQDVPFEDVVAQLHIDRDLSRHPLVQMVFSLNSQIGLGEFELEGLQTQLMPIATTSRFDLEFHFFQEERSLRGQVIFLTDLYSSQTISNMLSVFRTVLEQGIREPKTAISSLSLLTSDDFSTLDEMGLIQVEKTEYPRESSIVDVFRKEVSTHPDRVAVKNSSVQFTYSELDERSDHLARWLARRALATGTLVGVLASRSCQTVVAFLGILKANLAYLPFDVNIPKVRLERVLSSMEGHSLVLLGDAVQPPVIDLDDVEFVSISDTLDNQVHNTPMSPAPSPTSLAYVLFTSGSTGQPKGVMVEHRGIVRLVKDSNMSQHLPETPTIGHIANVAFDASTWEIFAALLNGGTLVCIDSMTVLDYSALANSFTQNAVQVALFTPALLKQCLLDSPVTIGMLETLYVGGDRLDPQDIVTAQSLVKGNIINAYGPTENSVASTIYPIEKGETFTNGVPIGRALTNSGAYVMDPHQRLVPLGVVGELVVTGDGLARGYTDAQREFGLFVSIKLDGKLSVRAYRTGDYVRYRPLDGQLECFGRMDGQIKIRGNRIELGEVEHVLRSHEAVNDAVALLQQEPDRDAQLVGFVAVGQIYEHQAALQNQGDEEEVEGENELEHVEVWRELFDDDKYDAIDDMQTETIGRDFIAWTSMYDGTEIDKGEMNEWLDDGIETILNGGPAGNVLEVGTGSGMILFNLTKGLESYVGLEPSQRAVDFVMKTANSISSLAGKVHVHKGTAADVTQLPGPLSPNLVVINSVA
ncbi:putative AMP-binding enzyme [Ilyonectria robusta]